MSRVDELLNELRIVLEHKNKRAIEIIGDLVVNGKVITAHNDTYNPKGHLDASVTIKHPNAINLTYELKEIFSREQS